MIIPRVFCGMKIREWQLILCQVVVSMVNQDSLIRFLKSNVKFCCDNARRNMRTKRSNDIILHYQFRP